MDGYAPNWNDNQILTWSGRWHIRAVPSDQPWVREPSALCGTYGYTRENVPSYVRRLQDISKGIKQAPLCKKCDRINQARMP